MNLFLLTPPQTRKDELALVTHFLQCGLHRLHIRKPAFGIDEYGNYITAIPATFHDRLVIHGAYELVQAFPALGIHLRSDDRQDAQLVQRARQWRPASCSSSFHSWEEIKEQGDGYEYVFISPVFDSISKKGYKAAIELAEHTLLGQWGLQYKKRVPRIVGLGGVDALTVPRLAQAGFEGAALLGAIWEVLDPAGAFDAVQRASGNRAGS
jgi:thiamine-phosphate pyrophosphorylase